VNRERWIVTVEGMRPDKESPLKTKSYTFGVRIVRLSQYLISDHKEYVLSKQIYVPVRRSEL
jgi:hypothetical protein